MLPSVAVTPGLGSERAAGLGLLRVFPILNQSRQSGSVEGCLSTSEEPSDVLTIIQVHTLRALSYGGGFSRVQRKIWRSGNT